MKKLNHFLLGSAMAVTALTSCTETDPLPDLTNADISFQGVTENQELTGTVAFSAQIGEGVELDQITFYVDDAMVAVDSVAPYEAEWDSRSVEDGEHTLKIVGEVEGITKEVTLGVVVDNLLLSIQTNTEAIYLTEKSVHAFITDAEGKVIGAEVELKSGEAAEIRRPEGFEGNVFDLHLVEGSNTENGEKSNWATIFTFQNMGRGPISIGTPYHEFGGGSESKDAVMMGMNVPQGEESKLNLKAPWSSGFYSSTVNDIAFYDMRFYNPAEVSSSRFLANFDDHKFLLTDNVAANGTSAFDFNNFVEANQTAEITAPTDVADFEYGVFGVHEDVDGLLTLRYYNSYDASQNDQNTFTLPYLPSTFDTHGTSVYIYEGSGNGSYQLKFGAEPNYALDKLQANATVQHADDGLTINTSGNYDFYEAWFDAYTYDGESEVFMDWIVYSNNPEQTLSMPEFPENLKERYSSVLELEVESDDLTFYDYEGWSTLEELYEEVFQNGASYEVNNDVVLNLARKNQQEYRALWVDIQPESTNARVAESPFAKRRANQFKSKSTN